MAALKSRIAYNTLTLPLLSSPILYHKRVLIVQYKYYWLQILFFPDLAQLDTFIYLTEHCLKENLLKIGHHTVADPRIFLNQLKHANRFLSIDINNQDIANKLIPPCHMKSHSLPNTIGFAEGDTRDGIL